MLDNMLEFIPSIPLSEWTTRATDWITDKFAILFDPIKEHFGNFMEFTSEALLAVPAVVIILLVAVIAFFITGRKFGLAAFSIVGLWLIYNQGLWEHLMSTFTLVLLASLLSVIIGVPI